MIRVIALGGTRAYGGMSTFLEESLNALIKQIPEYRVIHPSYRNTAETGLYSDQDDHFCSFEKARLYRLFPLKIYNGASTRTNGWKATNTVDTRYRPPLRTCRMVGTQKIPNSGMWSIFKRSKSRCIGVLSAGAEGPSPRKFAKVPLQYVRDVES